MSPTNNKISKIAEQPGQSVWTTYDAPVSVQYIYLAAQWVKLIGVCLFFILLMIPQSESLLLHLAEQYSSSILVAPGILLIIFLGRVLHRLNQHLAHRRRNNRAEAIVSNLQREGSSPFCLYLRPFITSAGLRVQNSRFNRHHLPSMDHFFGRQIDLETVFAMSLESHNFPLIAIGDTGYNLGAAKITSTEHDWKAVFSNLVDKATAIIMIPLPRPSTLWEIETILDNPTLLSKTLFVMPMRLRSGVRERLEPFWKDIRSRMRSRGVEFPDYDPRGALLFFSNGGATNARLDSGGFDGDYIDKILLGLINRAAADCSLDGLSEEAKSSFSIAIEPFVYISPKTGRICCRPMPEFLLSNKVSATEVLKLLSQNGWVLTYRNQIGPQAWREVNLHPAILEARQICDWVAKHKDELLRKGAVVETAKEKAARWHAEMKSVGSTSTLEVCHNIESAEAIEPIGYCASHFSSNLKISLRPEEQRIIA
jgi:hypothetical protein